MRKREKICWQQADGKEQQAFGICKTKRSALLTELLVFTVSTLLFLCTAYHMLCQMLFTRIGLSEGTGGWLLVVTVGTFLGVELPCYGKKQRQWYLKWGVPVAGGVLLLCFLCFSNHVERFYSGIATVAKAYLELWADYYGSSVVVSGGNENDAKFALTIVFTVLCILLVWGARRLQKNLLPVVVPLVVFVAGLLVGSSSKDGSILLLGCGVFLANSLGWLRTDFCRAPGMSADGKGKKSPFYGLLPGLFMLGLLLVIKLTCLPVAQEAVVKYADKLEALQKKVVDVAKDTEFWQSFDVSERTRGLVKRLFSEKKELSRKIDNETPQYEDKLVLRVSVDAKPNSTLYLKEFYADTYRDGIWDRQEDTFRKACYRIGYSYEGLSGRILRHAANAMEENRADTSEKRKATIEYFETYEKALHLPYFTIVADARVTPENDGRYIQTEALSELSFWYYEFDQTYQKYLGFVREREAWESWYESYVLEQYLDVPEDMKEVETAAEQIKRWERAEAVLGQEEETTKLRLAKALLVAEWVKEHADYSLTPPELPKGVDAIEFFLGTGKSGYCMHYASAAVLLMRKLGIPARYVSGYVVSASAFAKEQESYSAEVLDSNAHAWAEIYLNGVGWVPVECTDGYAGLTAQELLTERGETPEAEEKWQKPEQSVTIPEKEEIKKQPETVEEKKEELSVSLVPEREFSMSAVGGADKVGNGSETAKKKDADQGFYVEAVLIIFLVPICGLLKGVLLPAYQKSKRKRRQRSYVRLKKKAKRLGERRAICMVNRKLFKTLRRHGKIGREAPRDAEYEKMLRNLYHEIAAADWSRYMQLVKAAAFSYSEFSEADVMFCLTIYKKTILRFQ